MLFSCEDIESASIDFRKNLINCLSGFKSVSLVGTRNTDGKNNLAIMSQVVHIGANPALVGLLIRPATVERHTYENIIETSFYTLNHIDPTFIAHAHQTSARYSRDESEFEHTRIELMFTPNFFAPYVKDSKIKYGLKLVESITVKTNNTILLIGEVQEIIVSDGILKPDGRLDLHAANSITSVGLDAYYTVSPLARFAYAKPHQPTKQIEF